MEDNIELIKAKSDLFISEIYRMMVEELGIKDVFKRQTDRLSMAEYKYLIRYENNIVGFVNLVKEHDNEDFLFLDMGIKGKYKGQGIGRTVLNKIKEMNIDKYIIAEASVYNLPANEAIRNIGFGLAIINRNSYFLLQEDRLREFMEDDCLTKLKEHLEKDRKRVLVYKR